MTDVVLGLKFTADQRELQAAADKGVENIRRTGDAAKRSNDTSRAAAQQYTDTLKRQSDTLGMTRSQVLAYEAAQHKMTDAQRQSASASVSQIESYDRKTAVLNRVRLAAAAAGAALGIALVAGAKASVAAAMEAEQAQLRLEAVLRGTGFAAGFTGDELDKMASRMQSRLGINDETIKKSMATLLTFRQVGRASFEDALTVSANIAAVMGTDLQSATLQLGKALEDPEQGLTALTRSGVSFSAAQKTMIKDMVETGNQAQAITEILRIMKTQGLDGVAEAMNTGMVGASNNLGNAWDDLLETLGKTPTVRGAVIGTLNAITASLRGAKAVVEDGDWIDKLLYQDGQSFLGLAATVGRRAAGFGPAQEETYADGSGESMALRRGGQLAQQGVAREKVGEFLAQFKTDNEKLDEEVKNFRKLVANAGLSADEAAAGEAKIVAKHAKKGSKGATDGAQLITSLTEQIAQARGEATVFDKVVRQVTETKGKFTQAEIAAALAIAGEIDELARLRKELERGVAAYDRDEKQRETSAAAVANLSKALSLQAQSLQLEIDMMGATDAQREKAIALRELENKFIESRIGLIGRELEQSYALERVERDRIGGLLDQRGAARENKKATDDEKQARKKRWDDVLAEQKRQADDVERLISEGLMRGFERGSKSGAQVLKDTLINALKTLVLRPIIQPIAQAGAGLITGALGALGVPGYGNAAGGGGLLGAASNASSLFSAFGGGGGIGASIFGSSAAYGAALGTTSIGAGSQAAMLASQTGVFGGAGLSATAGAAGGVAGGAMAGLATAMPYIGLALAAYSMVKKDKGGPASFTGMSATGSIDRDQLSLGMTARAQNSKQSFSWQHIDDAVAPYLQSYVKNMFSQLESTGKTLGLNTSLLSGATSFNVNFAGQGTAEQKAQQIFAQLGNVSDELALRMMPSLQNFAQANESATQTLVRMVQVQEQLRVAEAQQTQAMAGAVRGLPGQLGITSLEGARNALAVSDYQSPTARLGAARAALDDTYQRGLGGDLTAVSGFGSVLQQALTIGRDVGASGPEFQALFIEGNRQLNELLAKQQGIQADMLRDVPVSVIQASQDQIAELRKQFTAQNDILNEILREQRRLREAA